MKKFCTKITLRTTPETVRPSENSDPEEEPIGTRKCYDVQAAQKEFDLTGTVSRQRSPSSVSSEDPEENFEDANCDHLLYSEVIKTPIETSKTNEETQELEDYDVPKIQFSFIDTSNSDCEETTESLTTTRRRSVKFGSDPNLKYDSGSDENLYKVPRNDQKKRLSKSLHDFNNDELNLEPLSLSDESIEHISCSQNIPQGIEEEEVAEKVPKSSLMFLNSSRSKAVESWTSFKSRFNRVMEEHSQNQRVGAFADKDKIAINLEEMYRNSKDKCKKMLKSTGKIFKRQQESNVDGTNSSQIIKNDAFFAKIKASDIEYVLPHMNSGKLSEAEELKEHGQDNGDNKDNDNDNVNDKDNDKNNDKLESERNFSPTVTASEVNNLNVAIVKHKRDELSILKNGFRRSRMPVEGQNGFDDLRRYVKQGGDFCKELASILQERSEAESQYSKSLSKLSTKLSRACREGVGGLNEAWKMVAVELESRAEAHRVLSNVLLEETAKPLKTLTESQHRTRKNSEAFVDKAARVLSDWRSAEAKSKKNSHVCARDNEKLQDAMLENSRMYRMSRSTSLIQLPNMHKNNSEKDTAKLEGKKRKAEDAVKKADIEYYSHCVRSERARLEWESAVLKGTSTFQSLEEERLSHLKHILTLYLQHSTYLTPKLIEATEKTRDAIENAEPGKDLGAFTSLRQSSQQISEQLLPDFYCEHITLAMNRERRKQALVKLLQLIKQDIEREKKSKEGLENLSKAIKQTPNFGAEDSQQTVTEKLYHMKSMLAYLEGARYKVQSALAELDCRPRTGHPLASHITITRDKAGLQQSILKVPIWLREQWTDEDDKKEENKSVYEVESNWIDRGMADGNSNQPDSDFDEFSSQGSSICGGICSTDDSPVQPIAQCKALYTYTPNLQDELALRPGDKVAVYRQQEDGWWLGECNGSVGIFPSTYVETLKINS